MNKQNQFYQNQVSTGIQDSWQKSTYSSRFYKTQKKTLLPKKHLPSRYQKAAVFIQRYWRFRQAMKRKVCQRVIDQMISINQCYKLENRVLLKLVSQYQSIVSYKQSLLSHKIKSTLNPYQDLILGLKKQCVITSFKLQKKNPKKDLLAELIHQKQQQKQLNLMLNRQKFIIQSNIQQEKKQYDMLLHEYKRLNIQHLQFNKQKNQLAHKNQERLLETSKFGSNHNPGKNHNTNSNSRKTFIVDFFQNHTDLNQ